jgi:hypothetical protein
MKGKNNLNREEFNKAESYLFSKGYIPINPFNLTINLNRNEYKNDHEYYHACMKIDLLEIINNCQGIYMLDDWKESNGANIEYLVAKTIGLEEIYYE